MTISNSRRRKISHRIVMTKYAPPGGDGLNSEHVETGDTVSFTFDYPANHDLTPAQAGAQFAAIQKHLNKAVAIANGGAVE